MNIQNIKVHGYIRSGDKLEKATIEKDADVWGSHNLMIINKGYNIHLRTRKGDYVLSKHDTQRYYCGMCKKYRVHIILGPLCASIIWWDKLSDIEYERVGISIKDTFAKLVNDDGTIKQYEPSNCTADMKRILNSLPSSWNMPVHFRAAHYGDFTVDYNTLRHGCIVNIDKAYAFYHDDKEKLKILHVLQQELVNYHIRVFSEYPVHDQTKNSDINIDPGELLSSIDISK